MTTDDPFTQAAVAILFALRAHSGLTAIVRPGNLIDMTADNFDRFKGQIQFGDTPELCLLQEAFSLKPFGGNARIAPVQQSYQLIATHDSLQVKPVNALKYQIMIALLKAGPDLSLPGLVQTWDISQGKDDATSSSQWRRGGQRWVSIMTISVQMNLDRSYLLAR